MEKIPPERKDSIDGSVAVTIEALDSDPSGRNLNLK